MAGELVPILIVLGFFLMIGFVTRTLSDNRVRRELLQTNADAATIENLFLRSRSENPDNSLKWGIVSVSIGIALVLAELMKLSADQPMAYGLVFIFGGGGLLVFYLVKMLRGETAV